MQEINRTPSTPLWTGYIYFHYNNPDISPLVFTLATGTTT